MEPTEKKAPVYRIKHIGINNPDDETATAVATQLSALFGLPFEENSARHIFVGSLFEVKKTMTRGKYGHIAMQTDDVEAAMEDLRSKGVTFDERSYRYDENGHIIYAYLNTEIAGFGFHLTL